MDFVSVVNQYCQSNPDSLDQESIQTMLSLSDVLSVAGSDANAINIELYTDLCAPPVYQHLKTLLETFIDDQESSPSPSSSPVTKRKKKAELTTTSSTIVRGTTGAATASTTSSSISALFARLEAKTTLSTMPSANCSMSIREQEKLFTIKLDKIPGDKYVELNVYNLIDVQNVPPQRRWTKALTRIKNVYKEQDVAFKDIDKLVKKTLDHFERQGGKTEFRQLNSPQ